MSWECESCGQVIEGGQTHLCKNPYRGYHYQSPPQPKYDTLVVGRNGRRAFKGGVEVDERTGKPMRSLEEIVNTPPKRKPGRPKKVQV